MTPYFPGSDLVRQWEDDKYIPYQMVLWQALDDTYHAIAFGYVDTRQPSPGFKFDGERFEAWQGRMIDRWHEESVRTPGTRGLLKEDIPTNAWLYLYERMVAANPFKPPPQHRFLFAMGTWVVSNKGAGAVVSRRAAEPNVYGVKLLHSTVFIPEDELGYPDDD